MAETMGGGDFPRLIARLAQQNHPAKYIQFFGD